MMAKAGMRRPDPGQPHGTENHPGLHSRKMRQDLYRRFREKQRMEMLRQAQSMRQTGRETTIRVVM